MLTIIALTIAGWIILINLFVAVMHTKAIIERGETIPKAFLYPLYLGAIVALLLDVTFNIFIGSFIYMEIPREFTFTARCKRHKLGTGRDRNKAKWWCKQLNKFDPDHC